MNMLSERKNKAAKKKAFCNLFFRFTLTLTFVLALSAVSVFAGGTGGTTGGGDALTNAKSLLASAATAGGGLWAIWGLVQLGMAIKDHNGPGIGGAIWQLIGGAVIVAAGTAINGLSLPAIS